MVLMMVLESWVVIVSLSLRVLGDRNDGVHLKTCEDNRLGQGPFENDCEYALRTCHAVLSGPAALWVLT